MSSEQSSSRKDSTYHRKKGKFARKPVDLESSPSPAPSQVLSSSPPSTHAVVKSEPIEEPVFEPQEAQPSDLMRPRASRKSVTAPPGSASMSGKTILPPGNPPQSNGATTAESDEGDDGYEKELVPVAENPSSQTKRSCQLPDPSQNGRKKGRHLINWDSKLNPSTILSASIIFSSCRIK
jgi:hypothetical protein